MTAKHPAQPARRLSASLLLPLCLGLAACSTPTQEANKHYEKAMALFKKGGEADLVQADREFREAIMLKKTLAPAIHGLALVAEKQGKLREEFSYLTQALEQDPNILAAQVRIGMLLAGAKQLDKAQEHADKALMLDRDDAGAQVLQGTILLRRGKAAEAVALAQKVLARQPNHVAALELLAGERLEAGDAAKALAFADEGLKQAPDHLPLLSLKLLALDKLARLDEIETILRRLIALHPETPNYRRTLIQFLVAHGRQAEAESELRVVAQRNPQDTEAKLEVIRFILPQRGAQAARAELDGYMRAEPGNHKLKLAMVSLLQDQGDKQAAQALAGNIAKAAGDSAEGLQAKGILAAYLLDAGDRRAGQAMIDAILAKEPRNEQALFLKSSLAIDDQRLDQAITDLRTILRDNPDSARALALLGKAHEAQGALELAEDHYAQAFQVSRMDAQFGITYAEFLLRRGQAERAEKLLNGLIKAGNGRIPALRLLAQARNDRGDWAGARQALQELQRLGG